MSAAVALWQCAENRTLRGCAKGRPDAPAGRSAEPAKLFARVDHAHSPSPRAWDVRTAPAPGRSPVPPCRNTVSAHCRALPGPGGEGTPSGSADVAASPAAAVAGGDSPRSLSDSETPTDWATFALPLPPAPSATPMPPPNTVVAGGETTTPWGNPPGPAVSTHEGRPPSPASGVRVPPPGPPTPRPSPAREKDRRAVASRVRLVAGRSRGGRRTEARITGPGGTHRRLVIRGEGREAVVGPRSSFEGLVAACVEARFSVVRVAGDGEGLARRIGACGRVGTQGG